MEPAWWLQGIIKPWKPVSHRHVLKKQNVFCNFEYNWYKRFISVWSQVNPGSKVQEQFLPKKKLCRELWPICQALLASKFGMWELVLTYKICLVSSTMFTRARGIKNLLAITLCRTRDKTRQDKLKPITVSSCLSEINILAVRR